MGAICCILAFKTLLVTILYCNINIYRLSLLNYSIKMHVPLDLGANPNTLELVFFNKTKSSSSIGLLNILTIIHASLNLFLHIF